MEGQCLLMLFALVVGNAFEVEERTAFQGIAIGEGEGFVEERDSEGRTEGVAVGGGLTQIEGAERVRIGVGGRCREEGFERLESGEQARVVALVGGDIGFDFLVKNASGEVALPGVMGAVAGGFDGFGEAGEFEEAIGAAFVEGDEAGGVIGVGWGGNLMEGFAGSSEGIFPAAHGNESRCE